MFGTWIGRLCGVYICGHVHPPAKAFFHELQTHFAGRTNAGSATCGLEDIAFSKFENRNKCMCDLFFITRVGIQI